ncbi:MAG: 4-hydroxythreonine-4-phosphate dehydrogenase PdxA [Chitinophagaceae bacterium]|nr:4-hydroxythreonine-4-phosphate dehydrogenase PdxA [Chitinophagaceae bacterium]
MNNELHKPIIGISCGDINGIGIELIIKSFANNEIYSLCTPVVFANSKCINFYRKGLADININYNITKDLNRLNPKQLNIYNCWEEEVQINPGIQNEIGGKYALLSLVAATQALKENKIDALVTAPIHKKNIQSAEFKHSGHTPYFKEVFEVKDVVMLMVAENIRVGLVTEHLPIAEIANAITKDAIISKLNIINNSLQKDFGIDKPRIAVLGLNPHAGDESLIGKEEETIIRPAILEAKKNMMVFGPYSSDAFFARVQHEKFDAVLAMYHDQGLIPFKSLAIGEGVNYTAGLPVVRTSPDHGTAFDIAGKGIANHASFLVSIFEAIDIVRSRKGYADARSNPLRKMSSRIMANAIDE